MEIHITQRGHNLLTICIILRETFDRGIRVWVTRTDLFRNLINGCVGTQLEVLYQFWDCCFQKTPRMDQKTAKLMIFNDFISYNPIFMIQFIMKLLVIVIQRALGHNQRSLLNLHEKLSSKIQKMTPKWPKIAKKVTKS